MTVLYAVCLLVILAVLEYFVCGRQLQNLSFSYSFDTDLAEPGQTITLTSCLQNRGRLPISYTGLSEYITNEAVLETEEGRREKSVSSRFGENRVNYALRLPARKQYTAQQHFHIPTRGIYTLGKYYLEVGDYLGLRTVTRSGKLDEKLVIMPERSSNQDVLRPLGGLLGDISVRRFLFEDPVLTVGTRDYTGAEPMKSIAWNQTARTGRMQVKLYDHTAEVNATVILNLEGGTDAEKEECLRLTRSVCEQLEDKRIPYEFYTNGDIRTPTENLSWLASGLGQRHFRAIMYGLGASRLLSLASFGDLLSRCTSHRRSNNVYVVITPPLNRARREELERLRAFSDYKVLILAPERSGGAVS